MSYLLPVLVFIAAANDGPKRLASPRYISPSARKLLDERMEHHGEATMLLSMSVVLLEYGQTWEVAQAIADQAGLARPGKGEESTLNAQLPARFFDLQDQLRARARELVAAAKQKDDAKLGAAYGRLTETCVACHAIYLRGPGSHDAKPVPFQE